jgi:hypothetical protein
MQLAMRILMMFCLLLPALAVEPPRALTVEEKLAIREAERPALQAYAMKMRLLAELQAAEERLRQAQGGIEKAVEAASKALGCRLDPETLACEKPAAKRD